MSGKHRPEKVLPSVAAQTLAAAMREDWPAVKTLNKAYVTAIKKDGENLVR